MRAALLALHFTRQGKLRPKNTRVYDMKGESDLQLIYLIFT